jgi:hypothetical protein
MTPPTARVTRTVIGYRALTVELPLLPGSLVLTTV